MELNDEIKRLLVERLQLARPPEEIGDETPLFGAAGLGLDSIDALELAIAVEKHFGVPIKNEREGQAAFQNISTLAAFIRERRTPSA